MQKTITMRVDENTYNIIKMAAEGQRRTISNYIEYATMNYTVSESIVDDQEMEDILKYKGDLDLGISDINNGRYTIIE